MQKAEGDLDAVFNEDTVDQRRGAEAIDRLTKARADMTKSVSEMSLRMRAVLTTQQWQELQRRQQVPESKTQTRSEAEGAGIALLRMGRRTGRKMDPRPQRSGPKPRPLRRL